MAELLDYNNTGGDITGWAHSRDYDVPIRRYALQSFVASDSYTVSSIRLSLGTLVGPSRFRPDNVRLEIFLAGENDTLSGNYIAYSTIPGSSLPNLWNGEEDFKWFEFTFSTNPFLTSGTKYILLIYVPDYADNETRYVFLEGNDSSYPLGKYQYSDTIPIPDYPVEDDLNTPAPGTSDWLFEIYGTASFSPPAPFPPPRPAQEPEDPDGYTVDREWDPKTESWTSDPWDLTTLGGGRYGKQLVVVGHRKIYFGEL